MGALTAPPAGRCAPVPILALNCGSSSLKFGLFEVEGPRAEALILGQIDGVGARSSPFAVHRPSDGRTLSEVQAIPNQAGAVGRIVQLLKAWDAPSPAAVGHRIVHGGPSLLRHSLIDAAVLRTLEAAAGFAPLHTPAALEVIRAAAAAYPSLPQAACLDTAFHANMDAVARTLPIDRALQTEGIRRYGFHGLSCESILHQLGPAAPERLVIAHLGAGASVTAVRQGRSIDTTMGLTPTGGVMMGTRSGDLDPGLLIYLMRERGLDLAAIEDLVERRSGLLGVSGLSGDVRELEAAGAEGDALLALEMFRYGVTKAIGGMAAALQGIDLIILTGGIGERDGATFAAIRAALGWMGVDPRGGGSEPSGARADCNAGPHVRVMVSQEDQQIARHTAALSAQPGSSPACPPGGR